MPPHFRYDKGDTKKLEIRLPPFPKADKAAVAKATSPWWNQILIIVANHTF